MGDYIPQDELEKFLSTCNDAAAQKAAKEAAERAKIQADNVGHRLLSKMGWKEGNSYHAFHLVAFHKFIRKLLHICKSQPVDFRCRDVRKSHPLALIFQEIYY